MKNFFLGLIFLGILVIPVLALAAEPDIPNITLPGGEAPKKDPIDVLNKVVNVLFAILVAVAALFIVIAAFSFITAAGDPAKVESARNYVLYALIGILVAGLAKGLVGLVKKLVE